jgi:hypothetical protein
LNGTSGVAQNGARNTGRSAINSDDASVPAEPINSVSLAFSGGVSCFGIYDFACR